MSGIDILQWFQPATPQTELRWAIAALAVILLLLALLVHVPRIVPGPLTEEERARARQGAVRRVLANAVVPLSAFVALVAAVHLIAPIRPPVTVVLHSRARPAPQLDPRLIPDGVEVLDLGPVVDKLLGDIAAGDERPTRDNPSLLRARVMARIGELSELTLKPPVPSPIESRGLDQWLIESVELSLVRAVARVYNVREFRIAPAAFYGESSWRLMKPFVETPFTSVELVGERGISLDGIAVRRISDPRIDSSGKLIFWAVVEGALPVEAEVAFRVTAGAGSAPVPEQRILRQLPPDEFTSRFLQVEEQLSPHLARAEAVFVSDQSGRETVRATRMDATPPRYSVAVLENQDRWQAALTLARDAPTGSGLHAFTRELARAGMHLPEVSSRGKDAFVSCNPEVVVIAASANAARSVAQALERSLRGRPAPFAAQPLAATRVVSTQHEPATVFSWTGLTLPRAAALDPLAVRVPGLALEPIGLVDEPLGRVEDEAKRGNQTAFLFAGSFHRERVVVLRLRGVLEVLPPARGVRNRYDPLTVAALLRTVTWATYLLREGWSLNGDDAPPELSGASEFRLSGPLVTESDIQRILGARMANIDVTSIAVIGLYLAALFFAVQRSARSVARTRRG